MKNGNYNIVLAPSDFPGKRYRDKYCYEHHLVYWEKYGVVPTNSEIIHHIDGNKRHNDIDNLKLMSKKEHTRMHSLARGESFVSLTCPMCGLRFEREKRKTHLVKTNNTYTFCSRSCAAKFSNIKDFSKVKIYEQDVSESYIKYNKK